MCGSGNKVQLDEWIEIGEQDRAVDFPAVHEALEKPRNHHARLAQVVELRYPLAWLL